ncbi:MAG: hypothetical protein ABJL75_01865 [Nonlabens ulvanivorans]
MRQNGANPILYGGQVGIWVSQSPDLLTTFRKMYGNSDRQCKFLVSFI